MVSRTDTSFSARALAEKQSAARLTHLHRLASLRDASKRTTPDRRAPCRASQTIAPPLAGLRAAGLRPRRHRATILACVEAGQGDNTAGGHGWRGGTLPLRDVWWCGPVLVCARGLAREELHVHGDGRWPDVGLRAAVSAPSFVFFIARPRPSGQGLLGELVPSTRFGATSSRLFE